MYSSRNTLVTINLTNQTVKTPRKKAAKPSDSSRVSFEQQQQHEIIRTTTGNQESRIAQKRFSTTHRPNCKKGNATHKQSAESSSENRSPESASQESCDSVWTFSLLLEFLPTLQTRNHSRAELQNSRYKAWQVSHRNSDGRHHCCHEAEGKAKFESLVFGWYFTVVQELETNPK